MNNKERGKKIREQILRDVRHHPTDLAKHIASIFSITPQAVNNHIKRLETEGKLISKGRGKGKRYFLGDLRQYKSIFPLADGFAEDIVWRDYYAFIFEGLPNNIVDICHYGFTEMVNNAIDHSESHSVLIAVERSVEQVVIAIIDFGEGIFKKIQRLCNLMDEKQALLELSKGKLTTDPENHTGEGIFFTSRMFEIFAIDSKGTHFSHSKQSEFDYLQESSISKNTDDIGTMVLMIIKRDSQCNLQTVFDDFAEPDEYQFSKTIIPVRLAQYDNEKLVSRSQAKRLLASVEKFRKVVFDFKDVNSIGQAFADEIFRVYANKHPEIELLTTNMTVDVEKMVKRATTKKD
ncbi:DUF4325 domain-containing protein [Candidatus Albibeggiatoa sp. nov. BB20]|uniref:STAS-like domain-containing protein n=1 Tax=Candidatus Albibeggiatoa sp. nov. BB20 TaxID=3162723 RepID=UPI0033654D02